MIPVFEPWVAQSARGYVLNCLETGWLSSLGPYVRRFEEGFSMLCKTKYAVAVSSGTSALHLALFAAGVGPEDEVIIPALTFVATANAVTYTGARPVFADVDPQAWTLDPK
jgi:perosamine synthetase